MRNRIIVFVVFVMALMPSFGNAHGQQTLPATLNRPTPPAASAPTVIPALVPFSGIAVGADGKPLTGEIDATFLIYKEEQGGDPLWVESQSVASDVTGHYKVQLGAANPNGLPSSLFASGEARWLEIQIAGEPSQPRVLLASVPYALKAADAATLGGLPASAFALARGDGVAANATLGTISPDATSTVTTTGGTANTVAKFSGANTIVNSILYDNGSEVGIGTTSPFATLTVNGTLAADGNETVYGTLQINPTGTATASKAYDSHLLNMASSAYNSSTRAVVNPRFYWQAEPTGNDSSAPGGTLNLLSSMTSAGPTETGFHFGPNGIITFASGQTFPGTGTGSGTITGVTAGTGLTGGGTSGSVMLNLNTGLVPTLAGNNTFTGSNVFQPSIYANTDVNIDNTNSNPGNISPGLRFGSASGEGMSSKRTSGGNQYGLDFYTDYTSRMSISEAGHVSIGTTSNTNAQLAVSTTGETAGFLENDDYYSTVYLQNNYTGAYGFVLTAQGSTAECTIDIFGDLDCDGEVSGSAKDFKIDHPLDPANKYLVHASVESSEMMNIYSGNVTTDELGVATVTLPDWFEAENGDFRYQLTTIGRDAHAWISKEVQNGQFKISTNATNVKVSWQITAVRQDGYAKAHPLVAEQNKPAVERGLYRHPEFFGQPKEKGIAWAHRPGKVSKAQDGLAEAASTTP